MPRVAYSPEALAARRVRLDAEREKHTNYDNPNQVLTLQQVRRLNSISMDALRKLIAAGELRVVRLSARRRGITVGENRRYQQRRMSKAG